ncbi:MAG: XRE family transcriptional regulator [Caulobacteraceae bacterium]|nr:XRE family transcriptional regulator [Caulobacteraceae bacterium]
MIEHPTAVIKRLRHEIDLLGSQAAWASKHGFSPQYITDILHGRRDITDRLANALGFARVTVWKDMRREVGKILTAEEAKPIVYTRSDK